jgi:hypothetical protein
MTQQAVGRGRVIVTFKDARIRTSSRVVASAGEHRATRLVAPNIIGQARILAANVSPAMVRWTCGWRSTGGPTWRFTFPSSWTPKGASRDPV